MRSEKQTVAKRIEEVLRLRLYGAEWPDLWQHASAQGWQISKRQLRRYMAAADARLKQTVEKDRAKLLGRHIAARRNMLARCLAANDYANARALLADEARLLGLYDTPPPSAAADLEGIDSPEAVGKLLASTLAELKAGKIDRATASTLGGLAAGLLRALEVGEMEERLRALEEAAQGRAEQ